LFVQKKCFSGKFFVIFFLFFEKNMRKSLKSLLSVCKKNRIFAKIFLRKMIKATNITKSFGSLQVLKGVDLQIAEKEIVTITGASGAGKTTLLQILGTLDKADSGTLEINGVNVSIFDTKDIPSILKPFVPYWVRTISHRRSVLKSNSLADFRNRTIGFVFQFHQLMPEFSALENVMMPALIGGESFRNAEKKAAELLDFLQLTPRLHHRPAELSGGEKQRVAVARALINTPKVILADEPSGSLDSKNKAELHRLFLDLRDNFNLTILIVTHDKELSSFADRNLVMSDGMFL
jgi:lipoprotein-releasing system ATP-binding protein